MKAVVVGSGVGSLASALRLRALGLEVEVLEACPDPGGRARTLSFGGTDFDAGPTVITAPWLFDELFSLFGERRADSVEFLPCDPWYRLLYADGSHLDLVPEVCRQEAEIARLNPVDARRYRDYLRHSEELYRIGYEELGAADFSKFSSMLCALPDLMRLGGFRTLWAHTGKYFSDQRIRQAFSLQTLLVGGNPMTTTAIYGLIHAMERRGGIWFAKGGTRSLIQQLVALAQRHGVQFIFNSTVSGFDFAKSGRIQALQSITDSAAKRTPADIVVWGGAPELLYETLGNKHTSWMERLRRRTVASSMGLFVLFFKTSKRYSEVAHHSIILSARWRGLLQEIFHGATLPPDPSLYLHRPAATDPTAVKSASEDHFYVLAPVPHLGNFASWGTQHEDFKARVLELLEQRVLPGLGDHLEFAEAIDPRYFHQTLLSPLGAGFSVAPVLSQSAWFRFHNRADRVPNLYLCGAGVHPGGGLPGVATSAKLVERLVRQDLPDFFRPSQIPNQLRAEAA